MLSAEQRKARDKKYRRIEELWGKGLTGAQIAKKLHISKPHLDNAMARMRASGDYVLAHRHDAERRRKSKHGRAKGR